MSRAIEIIDPDSERRIRRQRKILAMVALVSLCLFGYPVANHYGSKWNTLKGARKFALYLSMLKTRAIVTKTPLEARFLAPDLIEVYEVSSCGPTATRKKLWDAKLSDFVADVQFAPEPWVREYSGSREPILPRYCYDPMFGSSIHADGLVHGGVFLVHKKDLVANVDESAVQVLVQGASGDLSLE